MGTRARRWSNAATRRATLVTAVVGVYAFSPSAAMAAEAEAVATIRTSVSTSGAQARAASRAPTISGNGRFVVFESRATNLVAGDTNRFSDVFVRDLSTGVTERVSVSGTGAQGNGDSYGGSISANGRYVAFVSQARNLVAGDTNIYWDVFVRDRSAGTTTQVSVGRGGAQSDGHSQWAPQISADGRFVAFMSEASNLTADDDNFRVDLFVRDRRDRVTTRIRVASNDVFGERRNGGPSLSGDGRFLLFTSGPWGVNPGGPADHSQVLLRDLWTGKTVRIDNGLGGVRPNGSGEGAGISADGRYVVFTSAASNLVRGDTNAAPDAFIKDRKTGATSRVSVATGGRQSGGGNAAALSADGRYVVINSWASNLAPADTNRMPDAFVRDRRTGVTSRISVTSAGGQGNGDSYATSISADGRFVAFESNASSLVPGDTNGSTDAFVRRRF